jgi:hypothetical protein
LHTAVESFRVQLNSSGTDTGLTRRLKPDGGEPDKDLLD